MQPFPLARSELEPVLRPIERANGLPNPCYTDAECFAAERRLVFETGWSAAGFARDAAEPGDVRPVDVFGLPLLLARDGEGTLRVFHNVCSHRGMRLVDGPRRIKPRGVIACPYHAWCYGLDGALRTTPCIGGAGANEADGFKRADHGLKEVRSAVFMGVVFVNLSGTAPPFSQIIAPLAERWREFAARPLFSPADSAFELEVACNWKLAVENYCESYHLPWVHPGLNSYSRLEDHYHIRCGDGGLFSGQGSTVYRPVLSDDGAGFATPGDLSEQWRTGAEYVALYPNVLLGVHRDHCFAIVLEPHGPMLTRERVAISYFDESSADETHARLRAGNAALWRQVFEEDIFAVEGMQRGRDSPGFGGGVFSPAMDGPTHDFHRWVAARLLGDG